MNSSYHKQLQRLKPTLGLELQANNLKQMGIVFKMYANESGGAFPTNEPWLRFNTINAGSIYPEYLTDPSVLVCPSSVIMDKETLQKTLDLIRQGDPNGELNIDVDGGPNIQGPFVGDQAMINRETSRFLGAAYCYGYWPYVTINNDNYYAMVLGWKAYRDLKNGPPADYSENLNLVDLLGASAIGQIDNSSRIVAALPNEQDRPRLYGNAGGTTLYRMREGIERFLITDINNPAGSAQAQSTIPVMMDSLATVDLSDSTPSERNYRFNHIPGGCNVLYMDGHVEFIKFTGGSAGRYPVNIYVATRRFAGNIKLY